MEKYVWKKWTHSNYRKSVHIFLNSVKKMLYNSTFFHIAMRKKLYEQSPCPKIDLLSCK